MNRNLETSRSWICTLIPVVVLIAVVAGCATRPRIDWNARKGHYTIDQAILELGPPMSRAQTSDGTVVAEWLVQSGYVHAFPSWGYYGPYPYGYGYYGPGYGNVVSVPNYWLRLTFGPDGQLRDWKNFYR